MNKHKPVLLQEVIEGLNLKVGDIIFDGTLGGGGYSREILKKIGPTGKLIATDLDLWALNNFKEEAKLFNRNYSEIKNILKEEGIEEIDGIVLDLGISSNQLEDSKRGISFQNLDAKLDMNLSDNSKGKLTAAEILNTWSEESLADIIFYYGGEQAARKISKAIIERRSKHKFEKVSDLVELLEKEIGKFYKNKKINFATKTFQALRITVNDELGNLRKVLDDGIEVLRRGGRLAVVTFHSLEDRIVKQKFKEFERKELGKRINKKVIKPSRDELLDNPRSRSAKLRIFKK